MNPDQTAPRSSLIWVHIVCDIDDLKSCDWQMFLLFCERQYIHIVFGLFVLMLNIPVNNCSVISGWFPGLDWY